MEGGRLVDRASQPEGGGRLRSARDGFWANLFSNVGLKNRVFTPAGRRGEALSSRIGACERANCVLLRTVYQGIVQMGLMGKFLGSLSTTGVIAWATAKEAIRQPVFPLLMGIVIVLNVVNTYVPFFTLGDDVKMLKDCGLATILISGMILAIWTSSTSIADEIEGKTAMTLLSKPINRRQFVLGKYWGILLSVVLLFIPVIIAFLACVYFKVPYDAAEAGRTDVPPQESWDAVRQILPGIVLIFLEVAVMTAVSVAISTRLPMVVNMVTCLAVFVIGHLTPSLVYGGVFRLELVQFMARLFATVLPALDVFNIQAAVATGAEVPGLYLAWSFVYSLAYIGMAILLALILFEDRDLA
jgi:ABC-type transport system involved in multi-copper enzyme maturation permease subunit